MTRRYLVGDVFDRMADIPDGSVSLVACSPPFIALRSYLPADHPDKAKEIGSEPDPASFIDTLLALTAEWGRVLAPWGSIAIELGDTYSGSGGAGGDYNMGGLRDGQNAFVGSSSMERRTDTKRTKVIDETGIGGGIRDLHGKTQGGGAGWPRPKCLALIPQAYALSLAYGRNVLNGQESPAGQWLVRNEIVWHRPNPAVGALGDKVRPSTSYICVATRSPKRWFDLTAVRTEHGKSPESRANELKLQQYQTGSRNDDGKTKVNMGNAAGAPPLDCWFDEHDTWTITTSPSKLAHYAMWPPKLAERLILMMCPAEVCGVCGEPRRRVERSTNAVGAGHRIGRSGPSMHSLGDRLLSSTDVPDASVRETIGWTDCGHGSFTPGTVLDPFCGTNTTGCVSELLGRDSIGIDIDDRNEALMPARMDECKRVLFGTQPELPGQIDLFGQAS